MVRPTWVSPDGAAKLFNGDSRAVLPTLPDQSVQCVVTSPPYFGLRDYGCDGQIGLEQTPDQYVAVLVALFREARRSLRKDGTLWLNLADSYAGSGRGGYEGRKTTLQGSTDGQDNSRRARHLQSHQVEAGVIGRNWVPPPPGLKRKELIGIPWRVAFALQQDGWYLRQDIIWHKPNPMPESVTDRCTKAHEYIFLLSKSARYYFDAEAIREASVTGDPRRPYGSPGANALDPRESPQGNGQRRKLGVKGEQSDAESDLRSAGPRMGRGAGWRNDPANYVTSRNKRSVWTVNPKPYTEAHFATFPPELIHPCILAGCPEGGVVLDPFAGSGTTLAESVRLGRHAIGIELNPDYCELVKNRVGKESEACALFNQPFPQLESTQEMFK